MALTCPNCGVTLPDTGRVCPYCHAEVSGLRAWDAHNSAIGVGATLLAFPVFYFFGFWLGIIAWIIVGMFLLAKFPSP